MKRSALTLALLAAAVTSLPAMAQSAKDFEELRNEVLRLRKELNEMKAQKPAPAAPMAAAAPAPVADPALTERLEVLELKQKDAVVAGDIPGSFRLPGSETSIKLYGYAEVNAIREFKGDNSSNDYSTFLPYAPVGGTTPRKGQTLIHARTSRLGVESSTPTPYGPLGVKIEGDFNNDPRLGNAASGGSDKSILTQQALNSYNFRLRQAIGTFAGFTVGQTWSTFMDIDNSPETVDFNGPIGSTFIRQGVIRYTYSSPQYGGLTVAAENPVSYVLDNTATVVKDGFSTQPDLIGRWDKGFEWGNVSVRGVTQQLKVVRRNNDLSDTNVSKRGYGLGATGLFKLRGGQDSLSLGVTWGNGAGRYFNYIEGAFLDTDNRKIVTERALGLVAGYQFKQSDTLRYNFVGGWQRSMTNDFTRFAQANGLDSGGINSALGEFRQFAINRSLYQIHAGLIYNPVKNVDLGAEYIFGRRTTLANEKGDLSRVNLMARYTFN